MCFPDARLIVVCMYFLLVWVSEYILSEVFLKVHSLNKGGGVAPARMCALCGTAEGRARAPRWGLSNRTSHHSPPLPSTVTPGPRFVQRAHHGEETW